MQAMFKTITLLNIINPFDIRNISSHKKITLMIGEN